jgi:hypothetical protein
MLFDRSVNVIAELVRGPEFCSAERLWMESLPAYQWRAIRLFGNSLLSRVLVHNGARPLSVARGVSQGGSAPVADGASGVPAAAGRAAAFATASWVARPRADG